jgi:molecular chaperone HtpG
MTLGEYRKQHSVIRYVATRDQFRQISQVAAAESFVVINAGYVYDTQILNRLADVTGATIQPFNADELWDGILNGIVQEASSTSYARLHLNYENPLIKRVAAMDAEDAQQRCVELLYIQSLLMGHFPLRSREVRMLNTGLLGLIDWATAPGNNK